MLFQILHNDNVAVSMTNNSASDWPTLRHPGEADRLTSSALVVGEINIFDICLRVYTFLDLTSLKGLMVESYVAGVSGEELE